MSELKFSNSKRQQPILFCGGGTLGTCAPLLAAIEELKKIEPDLPMCWVGNGEENIKKAVAQSGLTYYEIATFKAPRYLTWSWPIQPLKMLQALWSAWRLVEKIYPKVIVNAGSFVGVPIILVGKLFGCKVLVHQQDRQPSLSNVLTAYFANMVTVSFEDMKHVFQPKIGKYLGNPVRASLLEAYSNLQPTNDNLQTVLIIGGSSGALGLNEKIETCLPELVRNFSVRHLTGYNKGPKFQHNNYEQIEFSISLMPKLYAKAQVVISRCGLNAISELAALKKKTIFVPLPDSHQEINGAWLKERGAIVLNQAEITPKVLLKAIDEVIVAENFEWWNFYRAGAALDMVKLILELYN